MKSREYYNAMLVANYCEQLIDETCNGDLGFNNHFRGMLTDKDCIQLAERAEELKRYAEICHEK